MVGIRKIKKLRVGDYTYHLADVLNEIKSPLFFKIAGKKIKVKSIFENWFTVDHYLFLKDDYAGIDTITIPLVCLASDELNINLNDEASVECWKKKALEIKLIDGYPIARYTWACFDELINRENVLHHEPTPDEIEAGIELFKKYSDWGTLFSIARELHITIEQVRKLPYNEAFLILNYLKDESDFREKYYKIVLNKMKNEK